MVYFTEWFAFGVPKVSCLWVLVLNKSFQSLLHHQALAACICTWCIVERIILDKSTILGMLHTLKRKFAGISLFNVFKERDLCGEIGRCFAGETRVPTRSTQCSHSYILTSVEFLYTTHVLPCHIHLPMCLWIMDPLSRAPKKNTSHGNEVLPQDTTHLIQRPCCQRGSLCQDSAGNWTTRRPPDHCKETQTAVVRTCGQTTVNKWAPIRYSPQIPLKMFFKNPTTTTSTQKKSTVTPTNIYCGWI